MTQRELEKRIKILEDAKAIEDLQNQYIYWLINRQWDEVIDCFTEDATANVYNHGLRKGKADITNMFKEEMSKVNWGKGRDGHFLVQPIVSVNNGQAEAQWLLFILVSDPVTGKAQQWLCGRYENKYIKVDGKWKISALKWTYPWPREPSSFPREDE